MRRDSSATMLHYNRRVSPMNRELFLLRHAKSCWDDSALADRDRGLNSRGRRNAPRMGQALSERIPAQVIHVSPARRAQLTLGGLHDGWPELQNFEHITTDALYTFGADELIDWIRLQPDEVHSLFIIGHNPALTDLVNWLSGDYALDNLPTAGFVALSLQATSWQGVSPGCGVITDTLVPKRLDTP